jgi:hypothetical protein
VSHGTKQFRWNFKGALPPGGIGILVIAVVAMVAFTLGQFTFLGLRFLAHWPPLVLGGYMAALIAFSAVWGVGIECFIWSGLRGSPRLPMLSIDWAAQRWLAWVLIIFLGICALLHRQYQCLLVAMPALGLLVFAITVYGQVPIVHALRGAGRDRAAFAALLVLGAVLMFLTGEWLTVDHYRKGLEHFQNDHSAIFTIPSSGQADFFFDYERREVVLKTRPGEGDPLDVRRSLADFECK